MCAGKNNKYAHLAVQPQPDNYCFLMSVDHPGRFLNFLGNGNCGNRTTAERKDSYSQFFIRIEVCKRELAMSE